MLAKEIILDIAGVGVLVRGFPAAALGPVEKRYGAFFGTRADIEWDIQWGLLEENRKPMEVIFEETGAGWKFERGDFKAEWDARAGKCMAETADSEYSFDALLRVWLSAYLVCEGGGLFHGAGLASGGRGYLFIGRSGAGKSTLARHFAPGELLSDELTAVRKDGDGFRVFGTPFMGELNFGGTNISAPLDNLYILNREAPRGIRPVNGATAAAELWGTLMCMSRGKTFLDRAMNLCETLAARIPCREFSYGLEEGPFKLLNDE